LLYSGILLRCISLWVCILAFKAVQSGSINVFNIPFLGSDHLCNHLSTEIFHPSHIISSNSVTTPRTTYIDNE
ncbi:hypothetical protein ANOM_005973, partial [Aspergillus nomiae NRRL 13137]